MDGLDEVQDKDTDSSSSSSSDDSPEFEEHSPQAVSPPHTPGRSDQSEAKPKTKKGQTSGSNRKKDPASLKTLRFHIQLDADIEAGEGGEEDKYEFNWLDLIAEENERKECKVDDGHMGGNNFGGAALDPYASDDDEQLRALARKFENKYGAEDVKKKKKARKLDDYADLGYGYDSNDPFIDNSEVHDEIVPANLTTAHGGFYVNIGALEFKTRESADEDSDVEAIINEGEKAEKKRKYIKKKESTGLNGLPDEPPAKKKKMKRIQNSDGSTTLVPINGGHSSHDDPTGASASGSMDEGDGRPKKPRIRREGAKPLGRPKKRNPDGSLVHPPKMPKAKRPGFESNGSAGRLKISPNSMNDGKILKNKKGRSVMKVNTPGSFANSSNSTSVVDLTDGDEKLTPKSQKTANECNDDVVKLLQSVSDQVGKKLTAGEAASTSYKGVTITPTAAGSKPKKSGCATPSVSLVATSTSSGGSKNKPASAVTVKKLLEEQNHQQKAKNQTPQPVPVKRKPSSAASNTQALQHQKKKQQLQQQLAQQQQQDLMNYLTALAAYQQAGSPSGKNSTNAELLSALAGLSASGTMTPELYAQLLATQGQMNDVLLQQFAASFYPTSASLSALTTSSGTSRKGSVSGSSSVTTSKQASSSISKAKTTVTNSIDRKMPSSTSSPSSASSSSVVVSSLSTTASSGLAQAAASAAAATKAKHSSAHSIESLSKSSLQGTKAGQSLLVSKQGISQNAGKGSVQVVSTSSTKPTTIQAPAGSKVGNKSLTKSGADMADSSGSTSVLNTSSPTPTVPSNTLSSQQQQLLRQEQFEAEQKEFAQFELMAQAKFEREEIERLKADQEKRMKMIEQQKKEQDEIRKKQELADAQRKEEMKKKQEQAEATRKQEDLRKEALRKQQLEEKLRQEAIQRQNEQEAQRKQQEMLRRQQDQEILRKQQHQQEQERLRKQQEQDFLRKQQEQERLRKQQEQERLRKQQEQELLRKQQEQERLRKQQEQERLRKQQEQERLRKQQEQERLRKQQEQDRLRKQQQEQERARKLQEQEQLRMKQLEQEQLRRKQQEQEHLRRKQQEQELLRKQQLEQEALRKKQEEMELLKKRQKEQELLRKQQEQEQRKKQQQMEQLRQQQDHMRKQELLRKQQQQQMQQRVAQSQTIFIQDGQQSQQGYVSSSSVVLNQSPSSTISMSGYSLGNNANAMNGSMQQIVHSSPQRISPHQQQLSMSSPQPKQQSQLISQHTSSLQQHQQQQQQQQQHQIIVHQNISPRQSSQGNFNLSMNHTSPSTSNVHFLQQQKQQIVVSSPNLNQGLKMSVNHGSASSSTAPSSPSQQMKLPSMPNTSVLVSSFGGSPTGLMSPQSPMYAQANNSLMMNSQQMQQQPQANMSNSGNSGHIIVSSTNNVNNHHGYYSVHKQ